MNSKLPNQTNFKILSYKKSPSQDRIIRTLAFMTARKTCHYYKKTKCGSTTDNNEPTGPL